VLNALVLSFEKLLLSWIYEFKAGFMSKERSMFRWCLVCLFSVLVAVQILSQNYIMRDDLAIDFSLLIVVKKIIIIQ